MAGMSLEDKEKMFDEAIGRYESEQWRWTINSKPSMLCKSATDVQDPMKVADAPCRFLDGLASLTNMVDIITGYRGDINIASIDKIIAEEVEGNDERPPNKEWWKSDRLPEIIRPKAAVPTNTKIQLVIVKNADGTADILKHFILGKGLKPQEAKQICRGQARALFWRHNPWGVKKGWQSLLDRIVGHHIMYCKLSNVKESDPEKKGWSPSAEDIKSGFAFINRAIDFGMQSRL